MAPSPTASPLPSREGDIPKDENGRPILPDVSAVVLTAEEAEAALHAARKAKWQTIKTAQYWWDINHPPVPVLLGVGDLGRAFLAAAHEQVRGVFDATGLTAEILRALTYYFANDRRFEECGAGYSLDKGLMLVGPVGCGKTSMLRVWGRVNQRLTFGVVPCSKLVDRFAEDGAAGLEGYTRPPQPIKSGVCFDDLGTEPLEVRNYGNSETPMAKVLLARYDAYQDGRLPGCATHLTTNLPLAEIGQRYGNRVLDRMAEMFNLIAFPADTPSRRR